MATEHVPGSEEHQSDEPNAAEEAEPQALPQADAPAPDDTPPRPPTPRRPPVPSDERVVFRAVAPWAGKGRADRVRGQGTPVR